MYWVSGSLTIFEASTSSSQSGRRRQALGLREPFSNAFAATLASVDVADAVLGHVALDLHREELRGEHQAGLAVPGADPPLLGQRVERARRVLVEADHERDLRRAGREHRVRGGQRRPAGRAAVLDVDERHAGEARAPTRSCRRCRRRPSRRRRTRRPPSRSPASPSAARAAIARHLAGPTRPRGGRTGGCRGRRPRRRRRLTRPPPRAERERHRPAARRARGSASAPSASRSQALRVGLGQPRLDAHLARAARRSRRRRARTPSGAARVRRRLRREALDRPGPQRPAAREPPLRDVARTCSAAQDAWRGKVDRAAASALRADQPRPSVGAGDQVRVDQRRGIDCVIARLANAIAGERATMYRAIRPSASSCATARNVPMRSPLS